MKLLTTIRATVSNPWLWVGLLGLAGISGVLYLVFNSFLMPAFTRHDVSVQVPDVMSLTMEEASDSLLAAGLRAEEVVLRKPNLPRDVVIDQNPPHSLKSNPADAYISPSIPETQPRLSFPGGVLWYPSGSQYVDASRYGRRFGASRLYPIGIRGYHYVPVSGPRGTG